MKIKIFLTIRNFVLSVFYVLPVFSVIVVFLLYNHEEDSEYLFFPVKKHKYLWLIIKISAGLSLWFILTTGIEKTLFFIPNSWGIYDEDLETWTCIKPFLSVLLGSYMTYFIIDLMDKHKKTSNKRKA